MNAGDLVNVGDLVAAYSREGTVLYVGEQRVFIRTEYGLEYSVPLYAVSVKPQVKTWTITTEHRQAKSGEHFIDGLQICAATFDHTNRSNVVVKIEKT